MGTHPWIEPEHYFRQSECRRFLRNDVIKRQQCLEAPTKRRSLNHPDGKHRNIECADIAVQYRTAPVAIADQLGPVAVSDQLLEKVEIAAKTEHVWRAASQNKISQRHLFGSKAFAD